jgi:hypothetical protein
VDEGAGKCGWLLLRQSLHDPLLVLNVESDVQGGKHLYRKRGLLCICIDTDTSKHVASTVLLAKQYTTLQYMLRA